MYLLQSTTIIKPGRVFRLSTPLKGEYNAAGNVLHRNRIMERELIDRAEAIQQRILQLRDSL